MHPTQTIANLLLTCLRHRPSDDLAPRFVQLSMVDWEQLIALAAEQQVASLLYHQLKTQGYEASIPAPIWQALQKEYYGNSFRNIRIYYELDNLIAALQSQNIPTIVLKGPYLGTHVYESIALRSMVDIDILVAQVDLAKVVNQLQALGYQPITPLLTLDAYFAHSHHLPRFVNPDAVASLEIHWTITPPNESYTIAMDELWAHSMPIMLNNTNTLGLCLEDLLLHVCIHATYHHQLRQGVRFLCDIAAIVQRCGNQLDWHTVVQKTVMRKWQRGVFLALYATQQLLDAKIPEYVLQRLNSAALVLPTPSELEAMLFPTDYTLVNSFSKDFLRLLNTPQLLEKLLLFWQRVFLPREAMAVIYAIPPHSPRLYLCYFVRLKVLLGRYLHQSWRLWRGDPNIVAMARQRNKFLDWLEQS